MDIEIKLEHECEPSIKKQKMDLNITNNTCTIYQNFPVDKAKSHNSIKILRKRKTFNIEEKAKIIMQLETGETNNSIVRKYGIPYSTISTMWRDRKKIKSHFEKKSLKVKRIRSSNHKDIEEALLEWLKHEKKIKGPISGPILKEKANEIAQYLGKKNFSCSPSWVQRFRTRHNIDAKHKTRRIFIATNISEESLSPTWENDETSCPIDPLTINVKNESIGNEDMSSSIPDHQDDDDQKEEIKANLVEIKEEPLFIKDDPLFDENTSLELFVKQELNMEENKQEKIVTPKDENDINPRLTQATSLSLSWRQQQSSFLQKKTKEPFNGIVSKNLQEPRLVMEVMLPLLRKYFCQEYYWEEAPKFSETIEKKFKESMREFEKYKRRMFQNAGADEIETSDPNMKCWEVSLRFLEIVEKFKKSKREFENGKRRLLEVEEALKLLDQQLAFLKEKLSCKVSLLQLKRELQEQLNKLLNNDFSSELTDNAAS